jgi:hypothetical protein
VGLCCHGIGSSGGISSSEEVIKSIVGRGRSDGREIKESALSCLKRLVACF